MKKTIILLASLIAGLAVFLGIVLKFNIREIFSSFAVFSPFNLLIYLLVSLIIMSVLVFRWKRILNAAKIKINYFKLFSYKLAGYAVGYIIPTKRIGIDARVYLLFKERKIMKPSKGASCVMLDNVLEFSGDILFAIIGFMVLITFFNISTKFKIALIAALCASMLVVGTFFYRHWRGKHVMPSLIEFLRLDKLWFFNMLKKWARSGEKHNIRFLKHNRKELFVSFMISLLLWVLMFIEYKFALKIVGYNAGFKEIFIVLVFVAIAYLVPIPAALGVLEASQISAFSIIGVRPSVGIALSFLVRSRDLIWCLIGAGSLYAHGATVLKGLMSGNDQAGKRRN